MRVLGYARAVRCALGVVSIAGVAMVAVVGQAMADQPPAQPLYWWPAQVSSNGRALTVIFDSSCSTAPPRALVGESAASITIELLGGQGTQCTATPTFGQLRVALAHPLAGRAIVGDHADPRVPGGSPVRDVLGTTPSGVPRAPRVIGFNAMDAKLALRMAGLTPHATQSSLTAQVVRERQAGAASRKVLLAVTARRHPRISSAGKTFSLGAATPAPTTAGAAAPSTGSPAAVPTTCANADLVPNSQNVPQVEAATICLVNQQRAQAGLVPLTPEPHLQQAADQHSLDMVVSNYFSHTTPSGQTFSDRLMASGYVPAGDGVQLGENLGWGTSNMSTPASMVTAWMNSPEHRANILNPNYRDTGMGVEPAVPSSVSQAPGATYTQDFGVLEG